MRKTALLFLILVTVSTAAAQVDNINFEELPSTAETGEDLSFRMSSDGSALDRVILQSRSPGEPGFTDRREKICTTYSSCDWNFQHTENNARSYEYRFRVQTTNGGGDSSRRQTVTYYDDSDYYVEWVEEPPSTASRNSQVSMSVSAYDSAGRLDSEGVLHLQYRDDSGDWETFDRRSCSNTNNDNRCSNQGSTTLSSEKIQNGEARFRGKIVFDSSASAVSNIERTSIRGEDGNVDTVGIGNLPSEAEEGSSFDIYAEAQGENLQRLYIQEKDPDDPGWTDWRSTGCGGTDCSFTRNYDVDSTGEKDFRAYAEAEGDSGNSRIETVDFIQRTFYRIDSVVLDSLPDREEVNTDIDVTGEAEGRNLDELVLKTRTGFSGWKTEASESCSGSYCEFNGEFSSSDAETVDFKLVARAGGESRDSNIEVVTFVDGDDGRVDDVNIDNLPNDYPTDTDLEITGDADGENLDRIILQKRDPNNDWERVASDSCGNSNTCDFSHDYEENNEQEVDFRLRAEAGDDSETSDTETVNFDDDEDTDDQVDSVDINNLPSQHPVDESLTIEGEAEGENLDRIVIQERDPGESGWTDYRDRNCNNSNSCSISRSYTSGSEDEKEFRIWAEAGEDSESSNTESVEFVEDPEIESVSIENLPENHPVDQSLSISGSADGNNLDEIAVEQSQQGSNNWNEIEDEDCNNSNSCSITASYTSSQAETRNFRVRIDSDGETEYSSVETVDFFIQRRIDSISIQELPDTHPINTDLNVQGSMNGQNLDQLRIQIRRGFTGWNTIETENCGGSSSCSINRDFSTSQTGAVDFRVTGTAGSETLTSNIESVNFQAPPSSEVDSVSIGNLPSEQETGSSVTVTGSATGTDLENITVEYREEGQTSWNTLEDDSCSGSSCQISADYSTSSEREVDFRIKAWAGNDRGYSSIRTVSFVDTPGPGQPSVDSVSLGNLPDRKNIDEGLTVSASATGTDLDELRIQVRNVSESGWTTIDTENCNNSDSCSSSTTYSAPDTGEKVFRAQAVADSDTESSQERTVEFFIEGDVFSVQINNLPDQHPVNTDLSITGSAQGSNLDQIILQRRQGFSGGWTNVESSACSGSSCNFDTDYISTQPATFDFRLVAEANGERSTSGIETVRFQQQGPEDLIDSVELEAPSSAQVGDEILLNGSASGEVDTLIIERRESNGWTQVDSTGCSSSPCELTAEFTGDTAGTETFRARAVSAGGSLSSDEESVTFSETPDITDVDIDSLPETYPVNQELTVSGSAEGTNLVDIEIQDRESSSGDWNTVRSESCDSSSSCSIQDTVEEFDPTTRDYRIVAFTTEDNATSGTETVTFYEPTTTEDPGVFSVGIDNLPDTHPADEELEIEAEASGNQLDSLRIQKRDGFTGWEEVDTENCRQRDSCSINVDFDAEEPGTVDFRARAEAGTETRFSNIESVRFRDDASGNEASLRVLVEDEDDNELEDARVRVRNGDTQTRYTDDDGEANFDLEPDDYEIRVSKDGYDPEERDIELDEGETQTERFTLEEDEDFETEDETRITSLDYDREICKGDDLTVNVQISNYGDNDETVSVSGSGLGSTRTKTVDIDENEVRDIDITFENIQNTGERSFTVRIENGESHTRTGSVNVSSCDDIGREESDPGVPTGLSARLDPDTVIVGETARIYGDVQGVRSPVDVRVRSEDFDRTVSSTRSGSYQVFITPQQPGTREFRISSGGVSTTRTLEVLPRASIEMVDAPRKVFEGEEFEICATVNSDVDARILLEENGETIRAVNDNGEICFDVEAGSEGEKTYRFRALTSGTGSSAVRKVKVLEADNEFDSFPDQIATVETEPGQAKVEVYNTRESVTEYSISVEDIDDRWVSQTERNIVLPRGDRDTVYFYLSSRKAGTFNPTINVEADGETVFEREITLESLNAEEKDERGFLECLRCSLGL